MANINWVILESKIYNRGLAGYARWWQNQIEKKRHVLDLVPEVLLVMREVLDEDME